MDDGTGSPETSEATALRPARFKVTAARFLKDIAFPPTWGEVGTTIEVTLSPDSQRAG